MKTITTRFHALLRGAVLGCLGCVFFHASIQAVELPADSSARIANDANPYLKAPGGAWRLAAGDVDGDRKPEIAYVGIDRALRCMNPDTGKILWTYPLDAFGYQVRATDLDGDGKSEFLVPCASGVLHVVSPNGQQCWTHRSPFQILDTAVVESKTGEKLVACGGYAETLYMLNSQGELCNQHEIAFPNPADAGRKRYIQRMVAADLDGDGNDELAVVVARTSLFLYGVRDGHTELVRKIELLSGNQNWENASGVFQVQSVAASDLDGNGSEELILGESFWSGHKVQVLSGDGEQRWISPTLSRQGYATGDGNFEFYSFAMVRALELDVRHDGKEIIALSGSNFRIFSAVGDELAIFDSALGFCDLLIGDGELFLGSTPNGDQTLYRIPLNANWKQKISSLKRHGLPAEIGRSIARLREQVLQNEGSADVDGEVYRFPLFPSRLASGATKRMDDFRRAMGPYQNLVASTMIDLLEDRPALGTDGKPFRKPHSWSGPASREKLIQTVRDYEAKQVPMMIVIAHSTRAQITLETVKAIIAEAPEMLDGFVCSELMQLEFLPRFFQRYFGPLQDLCLAGEKPKCYTRNKNSWWAAVPSRKDLFDAFIAEPRGTALVAGVEPSNSRSYPIDLCAKMGLRQAGLIDHIQTTVIEDWFHASNDCYWLYPKHGHLYLRPLIVGVLMGADHLKFRIPHFRDGTFTRMGRESTEIVFHMLGKGLLKRPQPEDMIGISKVGIAVHPMPDTWINEAFNNHNPGLWKRTCDTPEMHDAVMPKNGVTWAYSPTPVHALERVLFHKQWQMGYIPATPYGPVAIVPVHVDLTKVKCVERWLHTDGLYLWKDGGEKLNGMAAANLLRETYEKAAEELPIRPRGDDVFFLTVRNGDKGLLIYAVDPGCFDPADRHVKATIQLPGEWTVTDHLSGKVIPTENREFEFTVPAGIFRIFSATRR
jgi:outer membrane protein assembly factor BamB